MRQAAPGTAILVSLAGALNTYGYVRLVVGRDRTARGRLIGGNVSFMPSRADFGPELGPLMRAAHTRKRDTDGRVSEFDPQLLGDADFRWTAQLFVPDTRMVSMTDEHATGQWFIHTDGSWAAAETDRATGDVLIYEGGRHPIWSRLEDAACWWQRHDQPTIELFHLHVTADTNTFTMSTAGTAWTRPS